jgi:hypothetical protein
MSVAGGTDGTELSGNEWETGKTDAGGSTASTAPPAELEGINELAI